MALHQRLSQWQKILLGILLFPLLPFYLCAYYLIRKKKNEEIQPEEGRRTDGQNVNNIFSITSRNKVHEQNSEEIQQEEGQRTDGQNDFSIFSTTSGNKDIQKAGNQKQKVKRNRDVDSKDSIKQEEKKHKSKPDERFCYGWDGSNLKSLQVDLKAFEELDRFASKVNTKGTVEQLVQVLMRNAKTELEKTRAIWIWVCYHIEYDTEGFRNTALRSSDPNDVLRTRKGVCAGYASIFQHMCSIAGLKCKQVSGFSKGAGYKIGQKIPDDTNHAWNMIYLEGSWHLLDSTWGAGNVDDDISKFTFEYNELYFLTHPAIFIRNHLPKEPDCQLLKTCVTREQYEKTVCPANDYYNLHMVSCHPQTCVIETVKGKVSIAIESSCRMEFIFELNKTKIEGLLKLRDNGMNLDVYPQKYGQHILSIFASREDSDGIYKCIMSYRVDCSLVDTSMIIPKCLINPVGPSWISEKAGLFNPTQLDPVIYTDDGCCTISFRTKKMVKITVELRADNIQTMPNHVILSERKDKVEFIVRLPRAGAYALLVFDDVTGYICNYLLNCSNPAVKWPPFPSSLGNPVGPSSETEKAGLLQPSHPDPIIHADDGCCTISFRTERMLKIIVNLRSDDIQKMPNHVILSLEKHKVELSVRLPRAGAYALLIFDDVTGYIGNYLIVCSNPSVKWPPFPSSLKNPVGPSSETEKAGLLQPSYCEPVICAEDGTCTISFALKKNIKTYCTLDSDEIMITKEMESRHVFQSESKGKVMIRVHLPRSGTYVLQVFIKPRDSTGSTYSYLCNYLITCTNTSVKWPEFPLKYSKWNEEYELVCPLEGVLPRKDRVFFKLKITGVTAVFADASSLILTDNGYWEGSCSTVDIKELIVSMTCIGEPNYHHYILKYSIA